LAAGLLLGAAVSMSLLGPGVTSAAPAPSANCSIDNTDDPRADTVCVRADPGNLDGSFTARTATTSAPTPTPRTGPLARTRPSASHFPVAAAVVMTGVLGAIAVAGGLRCRP